MSTTGGRVLPLRVPLLPGESLDSWLEALARRNGISLRSMLAFLGLRTPSYTRRLYTTLTAGTLRDLEERAGLRPGQLDEAVLAPDFPFGPMQAPGSRYCPRCLAEREGRWLLTWWLPWTFACTTHHLLLHDGCPACDALPRLKTPTRSHDFPAGICTTRASRGADPCGADLTSATSTPLPAGHPLLDTQQWLHGLSPDQAATVSSDLLALAAWLARCLTEADLDSTPPEFLSAWRERRTGPVTSPTGRPRPTSAAVAGILAHHARPLLDTSDIAAIDAIRRLRHRSGPISRMMPAGMFFENWTTLSPGLHGRFLRVADPVLGAMDRVRLRSCTTRARFPRRQGPQPAARARHIPQLLWPTWTLRLIPRQGIKESLFRAVMSVLLLLPGQTTRNARKVTDQLNPHLPTYTTRTLQVLLGNEHDQALPALCYLADYLDEHGSPIDYQRRRRLVPAEPISREEWTELCFATGTHPGGKPGAPISRHVHAQRHLHQLLTGSDLNNPQQPLAWRSPADRSRHLTFTLTLTLAQRQALRDYAAGILERLDIDEPVTWEPPEDACTGLTLPGPRFTDVDLTDVRRLVVTEGRRITEAADALNTTPTHIRLALEHIDHQPPPAGPNSPLAAWRLRQRARDLITREFLEREYVTGRKTLTVIAAETDLPRHVVVEQAEAIGITIYRSPRPLAIDAAWLREQYLTRKRSTSDIAHEAGTEDETIRRRLQRLGIPLRAPGVHSRTIMTATLDRTVPRDIRAAVEGTLHGWLRLHRFEIAMAFPTLDTAAGYLQVHQSALVTQFQRLERDIGHPLFERGAFGKPHRPTSRGKALLRALNKPHVRKLMHQALAPTTLTPMPDTNTLARATTDVTTRRTPGPLTPFDDIPVERIRIRAETLTLLRDLLDHHDAEFYAAQLSTRTGLRQSSLSPRLRQLEQAGWLTSRLEDDTSWLSRAPEGRGPGRRRLYYALTPDGRRAATHELQHRASGRRKRQNAGTQPATNH
ncbi:TniQ family protein [Streptomyces sp. SM12]|uniref:TniQ family protein n=1 Tax=Streptomyces sp. SM12 TaxID=1071602 RepID=UPI000CD505DA|nr:TniQ family protein [Streptomyces sp. SM12]